MKTRQGFVSNSSSSSFVVIGFDFPRDSRIMDRNKFVSEVLKQDISNLSDDEIADIYYNSEAIGGWIFLEDEESDAPKNKSVLGILISKTSSGYDYPDSSQHCVETYINDIKKVQEYLGIEGDIKIYNGVMSC